jgi:hypothetical protein
VKRYRNSIPYRRNYRYRKIILCKKEVLYLKRYKKVLVSTGNVYLSLSKNLLIFYRGWNHLGMGRSCIGGSSMIGVPTQKGR